MIYYLLKFSLGQSWTKSTWMGIKEKHPQNHLGQEIGILCYNSKDCSCQKFWPWAIQGLLSSSIFSHNTPLICNLQKSNSHIEIFSSFGVCKQLDGNGWPRWHSRTHHKDLDDNLRCRPMIAFFCFFRIKVKKVVSLTANEKKICCLDK